MGTVVVVEGSMGTIVVVVGRFLANVFEVRSRRDKKSIVMELFVVAADC